MTEKIPRYLEEDYFKNWEINASLQGPCYSEKSVGKKITEPEILPTKSFVLVRKYQKCGKKCKTCSEGKGHGPYYWKVYYNKETKKRIWKFVGKNLDSK